MRGRVGNLKRRAKPLAMAREPDLLMVPGIPAGGRRPVAVVAPGRPFAALGRPVGRNRGAVDDGGVLCLLFAGHRFPFGRGVVAGGRARFRHRRHGGGHLDGVLGTGQPGFLATGTANRTPGLAQGGRIDGVRCCTMGANDVHGAQFHSVYGLSGCYIATVNEPETITAAKPFCPVVPEPACCAPRSGLASGAGPGSDSSPGVFAATAAHVERS